MEIPDQTEARLRRLYGPSYVGAVQQTLKMMKEFHPDIEQFYNVEGAVQSPTRSNHPSGSCQCGTPATRQQQDKPASLKQMYGQSYMDAVQQSIELMARFHPDIEGLYNVKEAVPPPTKGARVSPTPKIDKRNAPNESCQCNTTQSSNNQGNEVFSNSVSKMLNPVQDASAPKQAIRQEQRMQERKGKWSPKADVQNKETVSIPYNSANVPPLNCEDVCLIVGNLYGTNSKRYNDCLADCEEQGLKLNQTPQFYNTPFSSCPQYIYPMKLPDFNMAELMTKLCFIGEYGAMDWPKTDCCPPPINMTTICDPPSYMELFFAYAGVNIHELQPEDGINLLDYQQGNPTQVDHELLAAGIAVLMKNRDIALWAACMVQNWSPDMKENKNLDIEALNLMECLSDYLTIGAGGRFPWNVTYVTPLPNPQNSTNATMWAFGPTNINLSPYANDNNPSDEEKKYGLIVPLGSWWDSEVNAWKQGGNDAFCAAVQIAATILHEFIHIFGDDYDNKIIDVHDQADPYHETGTLHEKVNDVSYLFPCWDEPRMVETIFVWAMSQRYACLVGSGTCCNMDKTNYFACSAPAMSQIVC